MTRPAAWPLVICHAGRETSRAAPAANTWGYAPDSRCAPGPLLVDGEYAQGGLVIRSACHYGQQESAAWVDRVRHVFYLGSPHLGAPLARAAGFAGWALGKAAETRPFVTLINGSSPGIKDLRHGYVLADDWADCDQDSCVRDHRRDTPLLAGANHYTISATVTADPGHPLGAVAGDLLVQPASAHGRRGADQHIAFPVGSHRRLGGMHHFDLLNHPAVWTAIRDLLSNTAHQSYGPAERGGTAR